MSPTESDKNNEEKVTWALPRQPRRAGAELKGAPSPQQWVGSEGSRAAQPWCSLHGGHDMDIFLLAVWNQFYRKTALLVWILRQLLKCAKFTATSCFCCGWNFYFLEKYISRGFFSNLLKKKWFMFIKVCYSSAGFKFRSFVTPHPYRSTLKMRF